MLLVAAVGLVAAFVSITMPFVIYDSLERGRGDEWGMVPVEVPVGGGAYRRTHLRQWKRGEAPRVVRIAAIGCFFLGQMIFPGAIATAGSVLYALFSVLVWHALEPVEWVLMLAGPTGLLIARSLMKTGEALLVRREGAAAKAERVSAFAVAHNLAFLVALCVAAQANGAEACVFVAGFVYAGLSLAHAMLLLRASSALAAYDAAQAREPAPADLVAG